MYSLVQKILDLDGEEVDLILVRSTECAHVPVKDDGAAIEANTNLTRSDALVSNFEGDALLEVSTRLRDGNRSEDGDFDLSHDLDAKVCEVIVDHDLHKNKNNYRQNIAIQSFFTD